MQIEASSMSARLHLNSQDKHMFLCLKNEQIEEIIVYIKGSSNK